MGKYVSQRSMVVDIHDDDDDAIDIHTLPAASPPSSPSLPPLVSIEQKDGKKGVNNQLC